MDEPVVGSGSAPERWWALHVGGELDLATAPALQARLGRAIARHRAAGLVLDLAAVTFMDCTGLRPLLRTRNRLSHRLYLRNVSAPVLRLLELADVASTLQILPHGQSWPPGVPPGLPGIVLEDLLDHRPAHPAAVPLGRPAPRTAAAHQASLTTDAWEELAAGPS
jgi:anti-anti-sigma factor